MTPGQSDTNLADGPGFDNMVIGALSRLRTARPSEIRDDLAVYGPCSVQAVTAALQREKRAGVVERVGTTNSWRFR